MNRPLAAETLKALRIIVSSVRHPFHVQETACGLSGTQTWILSAVAETPGITVSELSKVLSVHLSTASNMLDKLAKMEWVERRRNEADRRVVNVHLTPKGRSALDRAPERLSGLVPDALETLPEEVLIRLNEDLNLLIQKMSPADHNAASKPLSTLVR